MAEGCVANCAIVTTETRPVDVFGALVANTVSDRPKDSKEGGSVDL